MLKNIFIIGIFLFTVSCVTDPATNKYSQNKHQQDPYNDCMAEKIKNFSDKSPEKAKLTAHFICTMLTGHMDDRYFDCLPFTVKMLASDRTSDPEAAAAPICKYYALACQENPQHSTCKVNYWSHKDPDNTAAFYPGMQFKREKSGSTLLMYLASTNSVEPAKAVINRGADINESMGGGWTALTEARDKENNEMIEMLLNHGAK